MPDALELTVPIGTRIKVLAARNDEGMVIPSRPLITGHYGTVIDPVVQDRISVKLDLGGVFHLEPERVAVLKKAGR